MKTSTVAINQTTIGSALLCCTSRRRFRCSEQRLSIRILRWLWCLKKETYWVRTNTSPLWAFSVALDIALIKLLVAIWRICISILLSGQTAKYFIVRLNILDLFFSGQLKKNNLSTLKINCINSSDVTFCSNKL